MRAYLLMNDSPSWLEVNFDELDKYCLSKPMHDMKTLTTLTVRNKGIIIGVDGIEAGGCSQIGL